MATKPLTSPRLWGTNAAYTTGPFIGQPGKVDPGVGVAAEGHRPGSNFPTPAEYENYQQNRLTDWVTNWVRLGTFSPDATAHLVETDGTGRAGVHGLDVINGANETAVNITSASVLAPAVLATCTTGGSVIQADFGNTAGIGFSATCLTQPGTCYSATLTGTSSLGAGLRVTTDVACAAPAIVINYNGIGRGVRLTNTGPNTQAFYIDSNASTTAIGLDVQVGGPTPAIQARSGPVSGPAIRAFLNNVGGLNGYAVHATTGAASVAAARAGLFAASGAGTGLEASAIGNVAANAALRLTMQAGVFSGSELVFTGRSADSTSTGAGRMNLNSATGTITISDVFVGEQKDAHASRGGLTMGPGTNTATVFNNNTVLYTQATQLTLTGLNAPRRDSVKVTLRFSCEARSPAGQANGIIDVQIFDVTSGVTVITRAGAGVGLGAGYALPAAVAGWQRSIVLAVEYTIPVAGAGDRTFTASIKTSTGFSVEVRDASLIPHGAYT